MSRPGADKLFIFETVSATVVVSGSCSGTLLWSSLISTMAEWGTSGLFL